MPRARKVTKATQTDDDLLVRRLAAVEELTEKLQGKIADLITNNKEAENQSQTKELKQLADKIESLSTEMERKFTVAHNMMYEDKEILLGLEQEVEVSIPEKFIAVEEEVASKITSIEDRVNIIKYHEGKNREAIKGNSKKTATSIDAIEQELKSRNVIVFGIPEENPEECLKEQLTNLATDVLGMRDFKQSDIETAFRLGKPSLTNQPRKILLKFRSQKKRDEFYKRRKKTPISEDVSKNIYINDDLTLHRSKLFHDARKLVKQRKLHSAWTQHGNVMVRKQEEDNPLAVYDHEGLRLVYEKINDQGEITDGASEISDACSEDTDGMSTI